MEIKSMSISVVTTFHKAGYEKYGKRMIQTFLQNWPSDVTLYVYSEDCEVSEQAPNLKVIDLHSASPDLVAFKARWKDVPKANGDVSDDPIRSKRKDSGKGFKWDAVRFAHKIYSVIACAGSCDSDTLIWMDADTVCHSPITISDVQKLVPADKDICFLGRKGKYTECGLYSINLKTKAGGVFVDRLKWMYNDAENGIFKQDEWHDSFIFDVVRKQFVLNELDWSGHLITGEGHPLINSAWGAYLDHLKGDRKTQGRSPNKDLKIKRTEAYWQ
jgi:hypothetical protein